MVSVTNLTSVTRAAEILGDNRWAIVRMIKDGELRGEKLPGKTSAWIVDLDDVLRLAADRAEAAAKALQRAEAEKAEKAVAS